MKRDGPSFTLIAAGMAALICTAGVGAYFGALYGPDRKQYDLVSGIEAERAPYKGVTDTLPDIAGIPEPIERAISNPKPSSGKDHEQRDLAAQESMALWAFYMVLFAGLTVVVTGLGTYFIFTQIKLTRGALKETSAATDAMEAQTALTLATKRPYIAIECILDRLERDEQRAKVCAQIRFHNLGKMVAESVNSFVHTFIAQGDSDAKIKSQWKRGRTLRKERKTAILPSEERLVPTESWMRTDVPSRSKNFETNHYSIVIVASVHYRIPSSDIWHATERSFLVKIIKESQFEGVYFTPDEDLGVFNASDLTAHPYIGGDHT